jgi:hypothetical protein
MAVRAYRAVERVRPLVPERVRRELGRLTPTERRAAERGIELVESALCRALAARRLERNGGEVGQAAEPADLGGDVAELPDERVSVARR